MNLPLQLPASPGIVYSLQLIVLALVRIANLDQHAILAPVQLGTHRVPNWVQAIKLPTIFKLAFRKSTPVFSLK